MVDDAGMENGSDAGHALLRTLAAHLDGRPESHDVLRRAVAAYRALLVERDELADLAAVDPRTGAANRRAFDQQLLREVARAGRTGLPLCVVALVLDHDLPPGEERDALVRAAAESWMVQLRVTDVVARLGPAEFAVTLPGARLRDAARLAVRLQAMIPPDARVRAGAAELRRGEEPQLLLARAQGALLAADGAGIGTAE
jgi:diguanylate cyclase (GGDEF)-like protein